MGKERTLLLGNGLNRTLKDGFSWAEMMGRLGSKHSDEESVPFPIQFEEIAASRGCMIGRRGSDPYMELREEISRMIGNFEPKPGKAHLAFSNIKVNNVITTNYDSVFEAVYGAERVKGNPGSSRNVLDPIYGADGISFYHAHGLASWKNTLCLGHEHYASLISKIRKEFFSEGDDDKFRENLTSLAKGERKPKGIWPELLFTSDVAIVGLGLDYCEIDLWWLLSMRAALFSPNRKMSEYENRIVYYQVDSGKNKSLYDQEKSAVLESLGVEVVAISGDGYVSAYEKMAKCIDKRWS